jgi:hypothetical protein
VKSKLCNVCKLEKQLKNKLKTNKGIEVEIVLKKQGRDNWTSFRSSNICRSRGSRWYPDGTPVAEFCTSYTCSHDLILANLAYIMERAKASLQFDRMSNWQKHTRSSNHIHFSNEGLNSWRKLTKFALELGKLQEFFAFVTASTPEGSQLSWRNGIHRYNRFILQNDIKHNFNDHNHNHDTIAVASGGDHLEFRLPDGMIHPLGITLTTILMDAVYIASLNDSNMEIYSKSNTDLDNNVKKVLAQANKTLSFGETDIKRDDYIKYCIKMYKDEIGTVLDTVSDRLKKVTTQMINLMLSGKTLNSFTVSPTSAQRSLLGNQYNCYIQPFETIIEYRKAFGVPRQIGTRIKKINGITIKHSYIGTIKEIIDNKWQSIESIDDIISKVKVKTDVDRRQLMREFSENFYDRIFRPRNTSSRMVYIGDTPFIGDV